MIDFAKLSSGAYRRIKPDVDMCINKDNDGRCSLSIDMPKAVKFNIGNLKLKGIDIVFGKDDAVAAHFGLILKSLDDVVLFEKLCQDLADIEKTGSNQRYANAVTGRLEQWVQFLSASRDTAFPLREQLGLLGELSFVENLLAAEFSPTEILEWWRGPDGAPKDFMTRDFDAEIKACSDAQNEVCISNAEQLADGVAPLFLVVFKFKESPDGFTVDDAIHGLIAKIGNDEKLRRIFERKLLSLNYNPAITYSNLQRVSIIATNHYAVKDAFPRILPNILPTGIGEVRYKLQLNACAEYLCQPPYTAKN
ncbi:hypothetical protein FACS1894139_13950 [Planctomycetales bacterium]|nr:hypothetical protein FACS1894108_14180 [Planctomycetales bacterium]GHT06928.1 hypothetical protein FACS1894139_13950 [Planctomycetales bacterium]